MGSGNGQNKSVRAGPHRQPSEPKEQGNGDSICAEQRILWGPLEDPGAGTQSSDCLAGNVLCSAVRSSSFQEPPPFLLLAVAWGA